MAKKQEKGISSRRDFLKRSALLGGALTLAAPLRLSAEEMTDSDIFQGKSLTIRLPENADYFKPLDLVHIDLDKEGTIVVLDGQGIEYFQQKEVSHSVEFQAGGALGYHQVLLFNKRNRLIDRAAFRIDTKTAIEDKSGEFNRLLSMLYHTMTNSHYSNGRVVRYNGKHYLYFSSWFQDHVYVEKGMKYFFPDWLTGVDLYADGQREDGMIHDNYKHKYEHNGSWSLRFDYGNFVRVPEDPQSSCIFVRVPVENMGEFTFLEAIYQTWKHTGNDNWMKGKLDNALKAVSYSTSDPYRWSEEYELLKRGYTIDIWDFQADKDSELVGGDTMKVVLDKSHFNIMYGDNIGFYSGCIKLVEMLRYAGRQQDADKVEKLAEGIKTRIDKLSWNGEFYTHQIPIDKDFTHDFGVDTDKQVTLSNAMALNRGVTHKQAVAIIKTYQRLLREKPDTALAEWYACYPPFSKGWGHKAWNYMNGGITPIVAGELAHGAFWHGYEDYGVDILRRLQKIALLRNNQLEGCYKGKMPDPPKNPKFEPVSLKAVANVDIAGKGAKGVPGWTNEGTNDLHNFPVGKQTFKDIPFDIVDPAQNGRKVCVGLSGDPDYQQAVDLPVNRKARSLYLLHTMGEGSWAGLLTIHYDDGTKFLKYISATGKKDHPEIGNWWFPSVPEPRVGIPKLHVAWSGENDHCNNVGVYLWGLDNPHPDKTISKLNFEGLKDDTKWMILGVTLGDQPVYFKPSIVSTIPAHWAAAHCTFALMEGLAGFKNEGLAFSKARLAPRWSVADVEEVNATAKHESSQTYMAYNYKWQNNNKLLLTFTGTAQNTELELLIPKGKSLKQLRLNGETVKAKQKNVEQSAYALLEVDQVGVHQVELLLS